MSSWEKPFEGIATAQEAGCADDSRHFSFRDYGPEDCCGLGLLRVPGILVFTRFFSRRRFLLLLRLQRTQLRLQCGVLGLQRVQFAAPLEG